MVQYCFNWDHISAIAGLHHTGFCFRLYEGAVNGERAMEFLKALKRHLRRRLLILWDGAKPHRSRIVADYVDSTEGEILIARLPAYAPELNPVEYLWAWLKRHALANYCPDTLSELHQGARAKLKSAQRRTSVIKACWAQAELF